MEIYGYNLLIMIIIKISKENANNKENTIDSESQIILFTYVFSVANGILLIRPHI